MTLELNEHEATALLLLLKLGMDTRSGSDGDEIMIEVIQGLRGVPNPVIDRMIAKVSLAAGRMVKGAA